MQNVMKEFVNMVLKMIEESANTIREVELFVSKDKGRRWTFVARQPVESKKFAFRADSDGEYWFAFRTAVAAGNAPPFSEPPQLRVLVDTARSEPMVILPSQPSESGPLPPPKPERFRGENITRAQPKPTRLETAEEPESVVESVGSESPTGELETASEQHDAEESVQFLAPRLPGFEPPEIGSTRERNLLEDLLSGMRPFLDVQPVEVSRTIASSPIAPAVPNRPSASAPSLPTDLPAGSIARIGLNSTAAKPQIFVRWNPGHELWKDAQVDVFRSSTKEGPWIPIAINLSNSGEYWWFLTPEDMKPFYVAVRIRSLDSGTQMDVTHSAITIDPKLSQSPPPPQREVHPR